MSATKVKAARVLELEQDIRVALDQRDSARRLAAHAFTRLCAANTLLAEAITTLNADAEADLGRRIQNFIASQEAAT